MVGVCRFGDWIVISVHGLHYPDMNSLFPLMSTLFPLTCTLSLAKPPQCVCVRYRQVCLWGFLSSRNMSKVMQSTRVYDSAAKWSVYLKKVLISKVMERVKFPSTNKVKIGLLNFQLLNTCSSLPGHIIKGIDTKALQHLTMTCYLFRDLKLQL